MEHPEKYDFSNDGTNYEYQKIKDPMEKFFIYQALKNRYNYPKDNIMKLGSIFSLTCTYVFKHIPDPDSESMLLQKIYEILWDETILSICDKRKKIMGDTMNSMKTTLERLYDINIEKQNQKSERLQIKTQKGGKQKISIRYIISRYVEDIYQQNKEYEAVNGMKKFVSNYHTIGNFLPVPPKCNGSRGTGYVKDYWDLTLKLIYEYYATGTNENDKKNTLIVKIVGTKQECRENYAKWLDSFRDESGGGSAWMNFVEKNFLQDFVNLGSGGGTYGEPKELWPGHFRGDVLPATKEQIENFYSNASNWIEARSNRMIEELKKKKAHNSI